MSRRLMTGLALVSTFSLGAVAASLATGRSSDHASAHRTQFGSATTAAAAAAGRAGTTVRRLEQSLTLQPGGVDGANGTCPSKAKHAIGGFWGSDDASREGDLVPVRSTPTGSTGRAWEVGVKNVSATPVTIYVGVTCIK